MRGTWEAKVSLGTAEMRRACLHDMQDAAGNIYSIYYFLFRWRRQLDENEGRHYAMPSTRPIIKGSSDHAGFSFSLDS